MKERRHIAIRGAVQGVGFRPCVYRLATDLHLHGWVMNTSRGVFIEVEGDAVMLDRFLKRLVQEKPPRSSIQSLETTILDPLDYSSFEIRESNDTGVTSAIIMPDIATCPDCISELFDPRNRRYRYPFINCTNCGPRYSIIQLLPYDRPNTSMKRFIMCPECQAEYDNPLDRRFHAQPNACPVCGPRIELWNDEGKIIHSDEEALQRAISVLHSGSIVAMKGIGGFHLITLASGSDAVLRLRSRKNREEKPFAIMVPSLELAANCCDLDDLERRLLTSPEAPIVLVRKRTAGAQVHAVVENVAPRNPYLGIMLPYTPLHHLLMHDLGEAVVATSGNLSDEPICTDEREAMIRLKGIADVFLVHNRPIVRHVDDSIIRLIAGREMVMRRARGYAPLPVTLPLPVEKSYVAVGAHLKNTIAVNVGRDVFLSQHIGDLETPESMDAFRRVIEDLRKMYDIKSPSWICDLHPAYVSSIFARSQGSPSEIQHHHAHVASCMAENQLEGPLLGVSWDGTGFGPDSTVWGGEFFESTGATFNRIATFRCFGLPGGEMAIREPRRTALGALYEIFGTDILSMKNLKSVTAFSAAELKPLMKMLQNRIQTPRTSSVGRLFDAVASVIGVRHFVHYEGQAAMELEFLLENDETNEGYSYHVREEHQSQKNITFDSPLLIDWHPMLKELLVDLEAGIPLSRISKKFHNALSEIIIDIVNRTKNSKVVLTGGCFQNRYLLERSVRRLREEGFTPYWHQRVPPNDGGIALGQIYAQLMRESS